MKILVTPVTMLRENVYIYFDEKTLEGVVIDPGGEPSKIIAKIEENKINVKGILLTHGHPDHIGGILKLQEHTGAKLFLHKDEPQIIEQYSLKHVYSYTGEKVSKLTYDVLFEDGFEIKVGESVLKAIHTPGHTPGGTCFYDDKEKVLFSGDTLFYEEIGRYDLLLGNGRQLYASIKEKLFVLPEDVKVYPGHDRATTIGHEKINNPYVGAKGGLQ